METAVSAPKQVALNSGRTGSEVLECETDGAELGRRVLHGELVAVITQRLL